MFLLLIPLLAISKANGLCNGPERADPFNVASEWECAETCTDSLECSSYFFKLTTGEAGLCQLLDKFNDNLLSETITIPAGYIMKMALQWEHSTYYITPPEYDVAAAALAAGFDKAMPIASLGVTRYLKKASGGDLNGARRRCAAFGGTLIQEYNQEVSDALNAIYGPALPKRYLGLHVTRRYDDSGYDAIWDSGQVDWGDTQSGSCPKYNGWGSGQWTQMQTPDNTAHITVDVNDGMKHGQGSYPSDIFCQYFGTNIATGKTAGSFTTLNSDWPSNVLDGNW